MRHSIGETKTLAFIPQRGLNKRLDGDVDQGRFVAIFKMGNFLKSGLHDYVNHPAKRKKQDAGERG